MRRWFSLSHNIIAQAEFRHQRFVLDNSRSGTGWIIAAVLMLLPGALLSLIALILAAFDLRPMEWPVMQTPVVNGLADLSAMSVYVMNIALYFVLMLIALGLAYNSISREKNNRTWEVLLLTNVNAKQVVWGKWWASLAALWGDHFILIVLRVGAACLLIVTNDAIDGGLSVVLLTTFIIAGFTLADVAFTVALAIASALSGVSGTVSGTVVLALRVVGMVLAGGAYLLMLFLIYTGSIVVLTLFGIGVIGVVTLMTWLTLSLARVLAVRGSLVSPVEKSRIPAAG